MTLCGGPCAETIAVLGAGQMGAGIAEVSANNGLGVMLKDRDEAGLARGELYIFYTLTHIDQKVAYFGRIDA